MIVSRGIVFRLMPGVPPYKEFLTRSEALFAPLEWNWSRNEVEAYIFPTYEGAAQMVEEHAGDGGQIPMVPMVYGGKRKELSRV